MNRRDHIGGFIYSDDMSKKLKGVLGERSVLHSGMFDRVREERAMLEEGKSYNPVHFKPGKIR